MLHDKLNTLGSGHGDAHLAAVEPLLRGVLEAQRETLGNRHPDTPITINNLRMLLIYRRLPWVSCAVVCCAIVYMYLL